MTTPTTLSATVDAMVSAPVEPTIASADSKTMSNPSQTFAAVIKKQLARQDEAEADTPTEVHPTEGEDAKDEAKPDALTIAIAAQFMAVVMPPPPPTVPATVAAPAPPALASVVTPKAPVTLPAVPAKPVEQPAPAPETAVLPVMKPVEAPDDSEAAVPAGMSSATTPRPMETKEKTEVTTQSAEKILPRRNALPSKAAAPAAPVADAPVSRRGDEVPALPVRGETDPKTPVSVPMVAESVARLSEPVSSATVERPAVVDRTAEAIAHQAVTFKRIGTDAVDVSVRPERGTEISLHVSMQAGQVWVVARLERGDFQLLQAHWSGLQQQLGEQGIRVSALTPPQASGEPPGFSLAGDLGRQAQQRMPATVPDGALEAERAGGASTTLKSRRAPEQTESGRGWERWA